MNIQEENYTTIQFGKKGITETFTIEVIKNLRSNRLVKIKFLKNILEKGDRREFATLVINAVEQTMPIEHKLVGNTLFLKKTQQQKRNNN